MSEPKLMIRDLHYPFSAEIAFGSGKSLIAEVNLVPLKVTYTVMEEGLSGGTKLLFSGTNLKKAIKVFNK